jgi:type I restriction enzyme S subunit
MLDDKATQVAQKNINLATLRSLPIPLPPVERQSEFSQIVSRLEESKNSCRSHLERLDTLFAALQQRAFKGEM